MLPSNPNPPNCNMACARNLQKTLFAPGYPTHAIREGYICRITRRYVILKKPRCVGLHLQRRLNGSWGWRPASEDNIVTLCWGVCYSTIFKRGCRPGRSDWYPWVCMHKPSVDATRWITPYNDWIIQRSACWRTQSRPMWTRHRTVLPISMKNFKNGKALGISQCWVDRIKSSMLYTS